MYRAKVNCIGPDRQYYYAGDQYLGEGDPGRHFTEVKPVEKKTPAPESMVDAQIMAMSKPKIIKYIDQNYGIKLNDRTQRDELIVMALQIVADPQKKKKLASEVVNPAKPVFKQVAAMTPDEIAELDKSALLKRLGLPNTDAQSVEQLLDLAVEQGV